MFDLDIFEIGFVGGGMRELEFYIVGRFIFGRNFCDLYLYLIGWGGQVRIFLAFGVGSERGEVLIAGSFPVFHIGLFILGA